MHMPCTSEVKTSTGGVALKPRKPGGCPASASFSSQREVAVPGWAEPQGTAPLRFWRNNLLAIIQPARGRSHVGKWGTSEEPHLIIQFRSPVVYSATLVFSEPLCPASHIVLRMEVRLGCKQISEHVESVWSWFLKGLFSLIREAQVYYNVCVCVM